MRTLLEKLNEEEWKYTQEENNRISRTDKRPVSIKYGITGCVNCNRCGICRNGSHYERFPDTNSDSCANRIFAGDDELYAYIASQHD